MIEIAIPNENVTAVSAVLDPLANLPPTIGTNEMAPGTTLLNYFGIKGSELNFILAAMRLPGVSCQWC